MHLYIDESYGKDIYVLVALAVYDRRSQRALQRAVKQTIPRFEEYLSCNAPTRFDRLPSAGIRELKGGCLRRKNAHVPGLNDYPILRNEFFQRISEEAAFRAYILYFDRPELMEWMPKREERRYGRLLQNLLGDIEILPPEARFVGVTIDSQSTAKPVQQGGKTYSWRKRRLGQRKQRIRDRARHKRWSQQINALIGARFPGEQLHRKVWLVDSELSKCLQAADVIANFSRRYKKLDIGEAPYKHLRPSRKEKKWFESYALIADRVWWLHNRKLRKPKHFADEGG